MAQSGNSDVITREYLDSLLVEMRHLDNVMPDTTLELYGEKFDTPIMMAALSHLNNVCENGMVKMAEGAKEANAVNWSGMGELDELEAILKTGAKTIKIIKPHADNKDVFARIEHAKKHNAFAVGMDIDHAFNGAGEYDNVFGLAMRPKTTEEIKEFAASTDLPFIVKGVLSAKDAEKCVEAGVKGIVVSHHHGIMDYALPPLMILPEIVKAVDGQMPIFVDCGIVSGMDAFKALALGATAVSVGRAIMQPLSQNGAKGVTDTIHRMTAELKGVMARTGISDLKHMDPTVIHKR